MNCREAQPQIFAERDGALDNTQRAALEGHLASCGACRRMRDDLTAALTAWRLDVINVVVPDTEREWHAIRRHIRGGVQPGAAAALASRRNLLTWLGIPVGAAAALAVALYVSPFGNRTPAPSGESAAMSRVARADSIEAPGSSSTMVFVDEKSGWMFVVANDSPAKNL